MSLHFVEQRTLLSTTTIIIITTINTITSNNTDTTTMADSIGHRGSRDRHSSSESRYSRKMEARRVSGAHGGCDVVVGRDGGKHEVSM